MRYRILALLLVGLACNAPATPAPTAGSLPSGVPTAAPGSVITAYWLGSGSTALPTFTTTRPEWRLVWRETTGREALVVVQVLAADTQQVVATSAPGRAELGGAMPVRTPPGRYFLRVTSLFADWAVAIEERP